MNYFNIKSYQSTIIFVLIILNFFSSAQAESNENEFVIKQKKFILELYRGRNFFGCISETRRLFYYDPDNDEKYDFFINACYYSGMQHATVINSINIKRNSGNGIKPSDIFLLSHAYYMTGNSGASRDLLFGLDYATIKTGRIALFENRLEFLLREFEFEKVQPEIDKAKLLIETDDVSYPFYSLSSDMTGYKDIGIKSKWLSVSMSAVLPGSGQVYSGRIFDGLISFAAVAGSAACTYLFHKRNERSLMITFSFLTGLFYAGNIFGAYNSAVKNNFVKNQRFSDSIINKYNLSYDPLRDFDMSVFK